MIMPNTFNNFGTRNTSHSILWRLDFICNWTQLTVDTVKIAVFPAGRIADNIHTQGPAQSSREDWAINYSGLSLSHRHSPKIKRGSDIL